MSSLITEKEPVVEAAAEAPELPLQIIEPPKGWVGINWGEIWRYRELLYFLTWRDVKVRYKQTALGAAWAILQPLMTMVVFTIFFGRMAGLDQKTGGIPYPIFAFTGLLPWTFFAASIANGGNSLVGSSNLITKVYFPRLVIPLASVGAALVDLGVSFSVLLVMMAHYEVALTWHLLLAPLFLVGTILAACGVGALLSALTVEYRDFRYVVPFLTQMWMFVSPVIYPPSIVPERFRPLLALNPMAGIIDGFRAAFLGTAFDWPSIAISLTVATAFFLAGAMYFRKVERRFADVI